MVEARGVCGGVEESARGFLGRGDFWFGWFLVWGLGEGGFGGEHSSHGTHNSRMLPNPTDIDTRANGDRRIWEEAAVAGQLGVFAAAAASANSEPSSGDVTAIFSSQLLSQAGGHVGSVDDEFGHFLHWGRGGGGERRGRLCTRVGRGLRNAQGEGAQNTGCGCGLLPSRT